MCTRISIIRYCGLHLVASLSGRLFWIRSTIWYFQVESFDKAEVRTKRFQFWTKISRQQPHKESAVKRIRRLTVHSLLSGRFLLWISIKQESVKAMMSHNWCGNIVVASRLADRFLADVSNPRPANRCNAPAKPESNGSLIWIATPIDELNFRIDFFLFNWFDFKGESVSRTYRLDDRQ